MAFSTLTVAGINPVLNILGNTQQFNYVQNISTFQLKNSFVVNPLVSSTLNFETQNYLYSGFRWQHKTLSTDTHGSLTLQSFINADTGGTDIISFNDDDTITFVVPIIISTNLDLNGNRITDAADPVDPQDLTTKNYVDSLLGTVTLSGAVTGSGTLGSPIITTLTPITTSQVSDFNSSVTAFRLDQFAIPTANLNFNGNRGTNAADPVNPQDLTTKNYVDSLLGTVTLSGAVTGSGTLGSPIITTLTPITTSQVSDFNSSVTAFRLDQFAAPTANLNLNGNRITDAADPVNPQDAATQNFVNTRTITLSGAVTGSGTIAGGITTALSRSYCSILAIAAAATTITTAGTFVKINSVTSIALNNEFTSTNNRMTYVGTVTKIFKVDFTLDYILSAGASTVSLRIFKNGTAATTCAPIQNTSAGINNTTSSNCLVSMSTNDYVEIWATCAANGRTLTVTNINFTIIEV